MKTRSANSPILKAKLNTKNNTQKKTRKKKNKKQMEYIENKQQDSGLQS